MKFYELMSIDMNLKEDELRQSNFLASQFGDFSKCFVEFHVSFHVFQVPLEPLELPIFLVM